MPARSGTSTGPPSSARPRPITWWSSSRASKPSSATWPSTPTSTGSCAPPRTAARWATREGASEPETNRFFISKIYLRAEERGHGFASQTIRFYEDLCRARGLAALYLTVNKHNDLGVRAYRGKGFETIDSVETDIGQGFIMDDFIMEKRIGA